MGTPFFSWTAWFYAFRIHPVEQILLSERVQDFAQIISFAVL
jgi:hypothetical protein